MAVSIIFYSLQRYCHVCFHHMQGDFTLPEAGRHYAPDLQAHSPRSSHHPRSESQTLDGKIYHRVRVNVDGASSLNCTQLILRLWVCKLLITIPKPSNRQWNWLVLRRQSTDINLKWFERGRWVYHWNQIWYAILWEACIWRSDSGSPWPRFVVCSDRDTRARYWFPVLIINVRTTVDVFITHRRVSQHWDLAVWFPNKRAISKATEYHTGLCICPVLPICSVWQLVIRLSGWVHLQW